MQSHGDSSCASGPVLQVLPPELQVTPAVLQILLGYVYTDALLLPAVSPALLDRFFSSAASDTWAGLIESPDAAEAAAKYAAEILLEAQPGHDKFIDATTLTGRAGVTEPACRVEGLSAALSASQVMTCSNDLTAAAAVCGTIRIGPLCVSPQHNPAAAEKAPIVFPFDPYRAPWDPYDAVFAPRVESNPLEAVAMDTAVPLKTSRDSVDIGALCWQRFSSAAFVASPFSSVSTERDDSTMLEESKPHVLPLEGLIACHQTDCHQTALVQGARSHAAVRGLARFCWALSLRCRLRACLVSHVLHSLQSGAWFQAAMGSLSFHPAWCVH